MRSYTCARPDCGHVTRGTALAPLGWCEACREFTGRCHAGDVAAALHATGLVSMPGGWPWPCTSPGPERWRLTGSDEKERDIVLCAAHGDRLRRGASVMMEARGVRLEYLGSSGGDGRALPALNVPGRRS